MTTAPPRPAAEDASASSEVSLVIPVRNGRQTIVACVESVLAIRDSPGSALREIIVVDDHSTDGTADIVRSMSVTLLRGDGGGPGSARNIGWRHATAPLVWFVDADCVASPGALDPLLALVRSDPAIAGAGGSYDNALPGSLLATLIHEEIVTRHERMAESVDFLATFSVVYRRSLLDELGGFDPKYQKAQDAEFAYRVIEAGHALRFTRRSRVAHHHPVSLVKYLRTQSAQGYWRVFLHLRHRTPSSGDSYSSLIDHAQPPLAAMTLPALAALVLPFGWIVPLIVLILLALLQLPMTLAIITRTKRLSHALFAPLSFVRAYARAAGMCRGVLDAFLRRHSAREVTA